MEISVTNTQIPLPRLDQGKEKKEKKTGVDRKDKDSKGKQTQDEPATSQVSRRDSKSSSETKSGTTPAKTMEKRERRVTFSNQAKIKLIPSDQLPARATHMERSVSNPKRRLWVLHRLFQMGGRYHPNQRARSKSDAVVVGPKTPWPTNWPKPPPPMPGSEEYVNPETNDE